jgi:hypothetical protein
MNGAIPIILPMLMSVGVLPAWGHSRSWGHGPGGVVGIILGIPLVLVLTGRP